MKIIINFLILFLFFVLAIINARIFQIFWLNTDFLIVNNTFEFPKTMFFNIFSSIIIIIFFLEKFFYKKNIIFPKNIFFYFFYFFLIINTYFSSSPFISFFGSATKGHSFLMVNNLFFLYIIFKNLKKNFKRKILYSILAWIFLSSLIAIKEYFYPSFDYHDLKNRALQPFWHPNLLALPLILIIPYLYIKIKQNKIFIIFLIPIIISLFLTKSALAIFIFLLYNIYFFYKKYFIKKIIFSFSFLFFIFSFSLFLFYIIYQIYPEKLSSFISRFYLWETTINIIKSNLKTFFIWNGFETLIYYFPNFKNINLYIFENIWFQADRPHNIFLYFFYHFWIIWLSFFIYFLYNFFKNIKKNIYFEIFIIFLIFNFFNFSSIYSYLIIIFIISFIDFKTKKTYNTSKIIKNIFVIFIIFFSCINLIYSINFYKSEKISYKSEYKKAIEIFKYNPKNYYSIWEYEKWLNIEKIKSKTYFLSRIINNWNLEKNCKNLTNTYKDAETYLLCWDYFKDIENFSRAKKYYKLWLKKLPDLWNKNSKFYKNIFLKNFIQKDRFLNKKYSNLKEILKFLNK